MARGPSLSIVPDVSPVDPQASYQRIQSSPADFGALPAAAAARLGGVEQDVSKQLFQRYDQVASDQGFNNFQDAVRKIQYGDPNNPSDKGYMNLVGQQAMDARPAAEKAIEDARTSILGTMQTSDAKLAFDTASRRYRTILGGEMDRHYADQTRTWSATVAKAQTDNAMADIATKGGDPDAFLHSASDAWGGQVKYLQSTYGPNLSPDVTAMQYRQTMAQAVKTRADRISATDPPGAAAWLQNGTVPSMSDPTKTVPIAQAIEPQVYDELVKGVRAANDRGVALGAANQAFSGSGAALGTALPGTPAKVDEPVRARAQAVHDEAVKQGASDDEAWGWAANAVHESGATPVAVPGDGGISHGMFQLNKDELARYQAQHSGHLPEQDDLSTQLRYVRAQAAPFLAGARGPDGYASAITTGFEKPANTQQEAANRGATAILLSGRPIPLAAPPGASNNAPDHTMDRAAGLSQLMARTDITDSQKELALTHFERLYNLQKQIDQDSSEQAFNEYIPLALKSPGTFPYDKMLADNRLKGLQKSQMNSIYKRALNGDIDKPTEVSQNERTILLDGIRDGSVRDPNALVDAVAHNGLSTGDYNFVRQRFDEAQTENGRSLNRQTTDLFTGVEKDFKSVPGMALSGFENPKAGTDFYKWKQFAYDQIADAQRNGKPVTPLFDPNSTQFLGSDQVMGRFRSPLTSTVPDAINKPDAQPAASAMKVPTTAAEIGAAYQAGYYGYGDAARDAAKAALARNGHVQPAGAVTPQPAAVAPPAVDVPH